MSSSTVVKQIRACLVDEASYKANRKPIIQQIALANRIHIVSLVDTVKQVLKDKKEQSSSKFIAIYFLKEAMDTKDPDLVDYVKEKILRRLGEIAKSTSSAIFPTSTDKRIIKNFYQLLLECIYFWNNWFGQDAKGKSTKYRSVFKDVSEKVEMPKKALFFTKEKTKKAEEAEVEPPPEKTSKREAQKPAEEGGRESKSRRREEEKTAAEGRSSGSTKKPPQVQKIEQTLQILDGNKELLMGALTSEDELDNGVLMMVGEQFNDANKELQDCLQTLCEVDFPDKDHVMERIIEENAFTSTYIDQHEKLARGKITQDQFKANLINALVANKEKTAPKKEKSKASKEPPVEKPRQEEPKAQARQSVAPPEKKNTDFNVDFGSASLPPKQNPGTDPFGNFQSTPATLNAGRNSSPFDDFGGGGGSATQQKPQGNFGFNSFENAPRPPQEKQQDPFAQQGDVFGQFKTAPPQVGGFDDFSNFGAPQQPQSQHQSQFYGQHEEYHERSQQREDYAPPPPEHHEAEYQAGGFGDFSNFGAPQQPQGQPQAQPQSQHQSQFYEQHEEYHERSQQRGGYETAPSQAGGFGDFSNFGAPQQPQGQPQPQHQSQFYEQHEEYHERSQQREDYAPPSQERHEAEYRENQVRGGVRAPPQEVPQEEEKYEEDNGFGSIRGARKKEVKRPPPVDDGVGFDDFADYNFDDVGKDVDSEFNFEYEGGKRKMETPHSLNDQNVFGDLEGGGSRKDVGSKNTFAPEPTQDQNPPSQRSQAKPSSQNAFDQFGSGQPQAQAGGFDHFGSGQPQAQTGGFDNGFGGWDEPGTGTFATKTDTRRGSPPQDGGWPAESNNVSVSQQQQQGNQSYRATVSQQRFESPQRDQNQSMISTSAIAAQSRVAARFGDMESERLRRERDKINTELENVRRMYNGLKIEYDYMKKSHENTGGEYNRLRHEVDDLKRAKGELNMTNNQLLVENESVKKAKGALAQQNASQLKLFEDLSREIASLKQNLNEYDVTDQRQKNEARFRDLESSLRSAQMRAFSMTNTNNQLAFEQNNANIEIERLRQSQLTGPINYMPNPNPDPFMMSSNYARASLPVYPNRVYMSPLRERSRSPQNIDLMNMVEIPGVGYRNSPLNQRNSPLNQRNSPINQRLRADSSVSGVSNLLMAPSVGTRSPPRLAGTSLDQANLYHEVYVGTSVYNPAIEQAKRVRGEGEVSPIAVTPIGASRDIGVFSSLAPPTYSDTKFNVDRQLGFSTSYGSPPPLAGLNRYPTVGTEGSLLNTRESYTAIQPTIPALQPFVPKYSQSLQPVPAPTITLSTSDPQNNAPPQRETSYFDAARSLPPLPSKYSNPANNQGTTVSLGASQISQGKYTASPDTQTPIKGGPSAAQAQSQNPATRKANELLARAKQLRDGNVRGSITPGPGEKLNAGYERTSTLGRPTEVYKSSINIGGNSSAVNIQDFTPAPQVPRTLQVESRVSPSSRKNSPSRQLFNRVTAKNSPPRHQPQAVLGRASTNKYLHQQDMNRLSMKDLTAERLSQGPLLNDPTLSTGVGSLPAGLYQGSPVRERIVNRSEAVELKPNESLKIVERYTRKYSPGRSKSPVRINANRGATFTSQKENEYNPALAETLKKDMEALRRSVEEDYGSPRGQRYDYEVTRKSPNRSIPLPIGEALAGITIGSHDLSTGKTRKIQLRRSRGPSMSETVNERDEARIREVMGVPSLKVNVGETYFQGASTTKSYSKQPTPVKEMYSEGVAQYNLTGKKIKGSKIGKRIPYDHKLFDQFVNSIYGNAYYRDLDGYKNACLMNRATLIDGAFLQISSITRNEGPAGPNEDMLKIIFHYTNKSLSEISDFTVNALERSVHYMPQVQGVTLTSKYQLKQELFINFFDFRCVPYEINISFKHEGVTKQMNVVLPITINKFMRFKHGISKNEYKEAWKQLKRNSATTGYRNVNAKFLRNPAEINKYFDNNLIDITPLLNPKSKKKFGGIFTLASGSEYSLKLSLDSSRLKISVSAGMEQIKYEEWVVQYLSFLLTV